MINPLRGARVRRRSLACAAVAAGLTITALPAHAVDSQAVGQRYNDGLDSRLSASTLISTTKSLGYTGSAWTAGRSADQAWNDALGAAVLGYFGHGNAGVFQVDEGASNAGDQFIGAGLETDLISLNPVVRWWSEYVPFQEVDDIRLAVLAACYTANADPDTGQFSAIGTSRGIDAVVGFTGLVYFPASAAGSAASTTNYSGNYFWSRFSAYAGAGNTVSMALSKARTDLVAKEGSAGGWQSYRIGGSVASPGSTKIRPAAPGEALTSQPLGVGAYSLAALDVTAVVPGTSPLGATREYSTSQGISFRRLDGSGALLDVQAPVSTSGHVQHSIDDALAIARSFAADEAAAEVDHWSVVSSGPVSHGDGDALAGFTLRPLTVDGVPGAEAVEVEVDRRTGAVTYFAQTQADSEGGEFALTRDEALALAAEHVDLAGADIQAVREVWNVSQWVLTVDRGLDNGVPDVDRVVVDARTGEVVAVTTT